MAESTLSIAYLELIGETGLFLGWGRGPIFGDPAFTTQQQASLDSCVKSGIRQVNNPPVLQGESTAYDWSFLKPTTTLVYPIGQSIVALPDDFGGFEGQITLLSTTGQQWGPIQLFNEGQVREQYASAPAQTGRPLMASLQPLKAMTSTRGQRFQLFLFPLADQNYTLQFPYYLLPDYINGANPYPYGGAAHAELYVASCKYAAERDLDDIKGGPQNQYFLERLAASVSADRRFKAQTLGPNLDRSDWTQGQRPWPWNHYQSGITVNGVRY